MVGRVLSVRKHPDAEKLYIEEVDCAEAGAEDDLLGPGALPRGGDIEGADVVVVANLKPRNMAGVPSAGMLLCANDGRRATRGSCSCCARPRAPFRASG